jgi:hypothetical protein
MPARRTWRRFLFASLRMDTGCDLRICSWHGQVLCSQEWQCVAKPRSRASTVEKSGWREGGAHLAAAGVFELGALAAAPRAREADLAVPAVSGRALQLN